MDDAPGIVEFVSGSASRVTVLGALADGGNRAAIQRATGLPHETLARILAEFEDRALAARAGDRYEATPLGAFLGARLASMLKAIEATQGLQGLLDELSVADPDLAVATIDCDEIVAPTSADPRAPARRFGDRLRAAHHVRLLAPTVGLVLDEDATERGDRRRTIEAVLPRAAIVGESSTLDHWRRTASRADRITVFAFDGPIDHFAGTLDGYAVVGLTDDAGAVLGYVETTDTSVRSWTEAHVASYRQQAVRLGR